MRLNVKVMDKTPWRAILNRDKITAGRRALANQVMADSNQYVPMMHGDLRQSTSIAFDGSKIYYHSPYAIYQYKKRHRNYTTPGTGPRWDKKARKKHGADWGKVFAKGAGF